jgi:uncharacterized protein YbaP (TraB family)
MSNLSHLWRVPFALALLWLTPALLAAEEAKTTPTRPFLWTVKSDTAVVHLLGSLHLARPELYPLDKRIYEAFDKSDTLAVEADIGGEQMLAAGLMMLQKGGYPPGESLSQNISKETYELTRQRLTKLGLPAEPFDRLKPWMVAMTLTVLELQKLGLQPEHGIDLHFLNRARGKIPIHELESAAAQINMLDGLTAAEQEVFLRYSLQDVDNLAEHMDEIMSAWKRGDTDKMTEYLLSAVKKEPGLQPIYTKLFDDRNRAMAEKIEQYLKTDKTWFVIVGAGHLVGETGLIRLLGKKYPVKQVGD